jgi:outer membrane protein assembly factor BamB
MDGNPQWNQELGPYNVRNRFGAAGSPALAGDLLIVVKDHEDQSYIAAFNKETGNPVWKKDRDEPSNWTTPLVVEVEGQLQIIVNGKNHVCGYDAASGEILWKCTGQSANPVPTPVLGEGLVFCTSGHRGNKLQAIKLGHTGDLTGTPAIAWENSDKTTPYVSSPLCYEDRLYVCLHVKEAITCYQTTTGKTLYTKQDLPEVKGVYASPIGVAGRVYYVGRNGVTCVLKNADTLEILAVNKLDDDIDCSPVVIGDVLYLKGKKNLYCIAKH